MTTSKQRSATKRPRRMAREPKEQQDVQAGDPPSGAATGGQAKPASTAKGPSKNKAVLTLLNRPEGATLDQMVEVAGWLPHTTRGTNRLQEEGPPYHQRKGRWRPRLSRCQRGRARMNVSKQIERLTSMTPAEVRAESRRVFGHPASAAFGTALTVRAIASRYQEKAFGGLTKAEMRVLERQVRKNERKPRAAAVVKPGTWISRTWHGEVHEVVVLEGGYEYRGARHQSLSAIARTVTGAKWSGPRFFGLHSRGSEHGK